MNFDDLKDQLGEKFREIWGQIQDSSTYHSVKEQFDSFPATVQKSILFGTSALIILIFVSIPLSFLDSASNYVDEFEQNRDLIRGLLKTRSMSKGSPLPKGIGTDRLKTRVESLIQTQNLKAEQVGGVLPLTEKSKLAPPNVLQSGVQVGLKQLNLTQIVDIGYKLQTLDKSVKMTGMDISATLKDDHYYDVNFKLVSFSFPEAKEDGGPSKEKPGRKSRSRRSRSKRDK